ncbi:MULTISPECIES: patatin-like protein [unclassified Novosphingobium]|uniref:patatin-like protein n=1 Tax=unclassified Novosphingobium TaxID=2644732 RepID=UPI0025F78820|nr:MULTISPECIES: patatin-like protein [unclassified Novosphingobium]HQV02741.1 patatin-like protein [Novosphingobium sp.]
MRQKELRIALVCYGGVSLAVYMHGVTKELWKLARASRAYHGGAAAEGGTEAVYRALLERIERHFKLRLRVLPDIVAGASAGGINGVFLAQAIHSGQSLEPLTELWLERADVDVLLDPDARPASRIAKFWAMPIVYWLLKRPGNVVSASVAPETRSEVRSKLSRLIRSRWFEPPFGGLGFSRLLCEALGAMRKGGADAPLLPASHPLDLFVTATDFKGHAQTLHLHSPEKIEESEHRLSIGFHGVTPASGGEPLANPIELVFAARATASFPGAFPALQLGEIDALAKEHGDPWHSRTAFVERIMPEHSHRGDADAVALIDGSVLVNAPFSEAMRVLRDRPAQREVDRRFVYIDPHPDEVGGQRHADPRPPGFFHVIFGSLSSIPREQPVRDNLEEIERSSRQLSKLKAIVDSLRPDVEEAVERLFGRTLFFDSPSVKRLSAWRAKAQQAAAEQAGFTFQAYGQVKATGILSDLAETVLAAAPELMLPNADPIADRLFGWLTLHGLDHIGAARGGASPAAIDFFRDHDLGFRIRRLRLLARRLSEDWEDIDAAAPEAREQARATVYQALSMYFDREARGSLGRDFGSVARRVMDEPGAVLNAVAQRRQLAATDVVVDALMVDCLGKLPRELRRRILLTYLGFPFYDTVTLPLLRGEGLTEFEPAKVDRISPDDCNSIRPGGAHKVLRGTEFYNFGAFFSRAYRENDYLWGRLHGAERMIDLLASALPRGMVLEPQELARFKREAFLAVLDEEEGRLKADPGLVAGIRAEVTGVDQHGASTGSA